jgi:hypothetical protein
MPQKRIIVRVVPNNRGGWEIMQGNRAISNHRKKTRAIQSGRRTAKKKQPSQLVIHGRDGKIQTEHTYKSDPYPPKG